MMAILDMEGGQGIHLLRAESPGPAVAKMVPRMADLVEDPLYDLFRADRHPADLLSGGRHAAFDALCNAFGKRARAAAIKARFVLSYSYYAQTVTTVFMALFGVNFSIYFFHAAAEI